MINENSPISDLIAALFKKSDDFKKESIDKKEYWRLRKARELKQLAWEIQRFLADEK